MRWHGIQLAQAVPAAVLADCVPIVSGAACTDVLSHGGGQFGSVSVAASVTHADELMPISVENRPTLWVLQCATSHENSDAVDLVHYVSACVGSV